ARSVQLGGRECAARQLDRRFAVDGCQARAGLRGAVANYICIADQSADPDSVEYRRLSRNRYAVVPALPLAAGSGDRDEIHRVSVDRRQPNGSRSYSRCGPQVGGVAVRPFVTPTVLPRAARPPALHLALPKSEDGAGGVLDDTEPTGVGDFDSFFDHVAAE